MPSLDTLEALERLTEDPRNVVFIISGRDGEFLEQHLGHIKNLGMSAEHGGFVREPGAKEWSNFTENLDMSWMDEVLEIFRYYTEVGFMIVWVRVCADARVIAHDWEPDRGEEELDYVALSGE